LYLWTASDSTIDKSPRCAPGDVLATSGFSAMLVSDVQLDEEAVGCQVSA
jgi:hypothetical protein